MMHSSPNSSTTLIPAIKTFSERFTCIAIDTPGFGLSDDSVSDKIELRGYADAVSEVLEIFGLKSAVIYGAATGAQIGIKFARRYPQKTRLLILDGAGHFSKKELEDFSSGYFVDLKPKRDGSHLLAAWDACRHLKVFFPWMSDRCDQRIRADIEQAEAIQLRVDDMLRADSNYKEAYWQAMVSENHKYTIQVKVPTLLARNQSSAVLRQTDSLIALGLPENFNIVPCNASNRYTSLRDAAAVFSDGVLSQPPPQPPQTNSEPTMQNIMVDVPDGALRARICMQGQGRPLMAIHDPAGSSRLVEKILAPYLGRRPVIAFDNPGNGESEPVLEAINSEAYAICLISGLKALGVDDVDVLGRYSGGPVAMEISFNKPKLVKHIIQAGVSLYEGEEQMQLIRHYTPSIAPRWDGRHLLTAWAVMRDQGLYWPWFNQTKEGILYNEPAIDVELTHMRVTEMLKAGDRYREAYSAMWTYPMREKLAKLKVPNMLCHPTWEPVAYTTERAQAADPSSLVKELPSAMSEWHRDIDAFLGTS